MKGFYFVSLLVIFSTSAFAQSFSKGARVCVTDTGKKLEVSWSCSDRTNMACVVTKLRIDGKNYASKSQVGPSSSIINGLVKYYRDGYDLWFGINDRDLHNSSYNLRKGNFDSDLRPMSCEEVEYHDPFGM